MGDYTPLLGVIDQTYVEAESSGTVNGQVFYINIDDGEIPRVYTFKIKAEIRGENIYWTDYQTLTINCPNTITITPGSLALLGQNAIVGTNDYYEFTE